MYHPAYSQHPVTVMTSAVHQPEHSTIYDAPNQCVIATPDRQSPLSPTVLAVLREFATDPEPHVYQPGQTAVNNVSSSSCNSLISPSLAWRSGGAAVAGPGLLRWRGGDLHVLVH